MSYFSVKGWVQTSTFSFLCRVNYSKHQYSCFLISSSEGTPVHTVIFLARPVTRARQPAKQSPDRLSLLMHHMQPDRDRDVCRDIRKAEPHHKDVWLYCLSLVEDGREVFQEAELLCLADICAHNSEITCSVVFVITHQRIPMSNTHLPSVIRFQIVEMTLLMVFFF